ncbi:SDR family oxidoreductase [Alteromonas sp. ASW11-19]|uniref:SDR family oxidoreductase n=1 Tax=Alteromonas salexigens TaxID=2982530 RepID=A0ABT2VKZ1_9ALTE|nr:SDR family oxidoreductase [Alteromonas salexigens]MCU7553971.1 SDR family oxidoreductase [Alteromonas salexigens]
MKSVLVIGASGQIGKMAVQKLLDNDHRVRALVRDANKLGGLNHPNLDICEQDLEEDFSGAFQGMDTVVFAAGSGGSTGPDKTLLIDLWAARNAAEFAVGAGVKHFVMVSSIGADDPDAVDSDIKPYLVAKHMADEHLQRSGLQYCILRPGSLLDEDANGKVTADRPDSRDDMVIAREDVANVIALAVDVDDSKNRILELFKGSQDPAEVLKN